MTDDLRKRRQHAKERMVFWARTLAKLDDQIKQQERKNGKDGRNGGGLPSGSELRVRDTPKVP